MSALLTTASTLQCPHGGTVSIVSGNSKVSATTALALASDTFTISGCTFQISGAPHPCTTVQWVVTNIKTKANSTATLSQASSGLCLAADQVPQGPVSIVNAQPKVQGL
jgi:hypothetical protein